jgi:hypothetical protein
MRVHDERGHALLGLAVDLDRDFGEHREHARVARIADPDLLAVEPVVRAVRTRHGRGAHRLRVGARARFGEAERRDPFTGRTRRQPPLLLVVGAEEDDPLEADGLMRAEVHGERSVVRSHFTEHAREEHRRGTEATVCLGDVEPHHPELGHAVAYRIGELAVMVELMRVHRVGRPRAERIEDGGETLLLLRGEFGEGKDEFLADLPEEDPLGERGVVIGIGQMGGHEASAPV